MSYVVSIYNVIGIKGKSKAKLKKIIDATVKPGKHIGDTQLVKYNITEQLHGEVWVSNIYKDFLFTTRDYPILYSEIFVGSPNNKLLRASVCKLYAIFRVKSDPNSESELFKKTLRGKFLFEAEINGKREVFDDGLGVYPGNDEMLKKLITFSQTPDMIEFLNELGTKALTNVYKNHINTAREIKKPVITFSIPEEVNKELNQKLDKEVNKELNKELDKEVNKELDQI